MFGLTIWVKSTLRILKELTLKLLVTFLYFVVSLTSMAFLWLLLHTSRGRPTLVYPLAFEILQTRLGLRERLVSRWGSEGIREVTFSVSMS